MGIFAGTNNFRGYEYGIELPDGFLPVAIPNSDCWEANRLFPAPIIKAGILEAVIPRRCPAELRRAPKPCLHERSFDRPGRKNLGGFFLYGKLDAFYSSLGRILRLFLRPWLIGVQSAGATLRDSEPEMNFTQQPRVHLVLKRFVFSMYRVRKKEDACCRQKA